MTPTTMEMPKPSIVTQKVFQAASKRGPLNSTNCWAICHGLGKMYSGMPKPATITCQSTRAASRTMTGDQRSMWGVSFMMDAPQSGETRQCASEGHERCR